MSSFQQAFDDLEIQIAYEHYCAEKANCAYEDFKTQLDQQEKAFNFRYLPNSPRHNNWLLWKAAWLASKGQSKVSLISNATHIHVPKELSEEKAQQIAEKEFSDTAYYLSSEFQEFNHAEFEKFKTKWINARALKIQADYKSALSYAFM